MSEPFENYYFEWLSAKVIDTNQTSPGLTYWKLFEVLHRTEFVWLINGDDNRAEDGKELRREFILMADIPDNLDWRRVLPCSIFEMFVAFSARAAWMTDRPSRKWFWEFIENLGLTEFNDGNFDQNEVTSIIERFIWRTYPPNGDGSMFPLRMSPVDQQSIELWYQLCEYVIEQEAQGIYP